MTPKQYRLISATGEEVLSTVPGTFGGNRRRRIYGRLDCRSAVGSLPTGYAKVRVFFADEATALAAGYRPCGTCMREEYRNWVEESLRAGKSDLW
ncbi:MAG: Ada metal-binding domain-containing protein [bacterium]